MEWNPSSVLRRVALSALVGCFLLAQSGCILIPVFYRGRMAPAACEKLEGRRVAVVCTSDASDFGPSPNAELVARRVGVLLAQNVKKIEVTSQQRVAAWLDEHDSQYVDYAEIGRDLNVDLVVGIEIESFSLQDSATLFKGNAVYRMEVVEVQSGNVVFETYTPPVIYPPMSGVPTTSASKEQFRRKFTEILGGDIARHFYEHDLNDQIAIDPADLGGPR